MLRRLSTVVVAAFALVACVQAWTASLRFVQAEPSFAVASEDSPIVHDFAAPVNSQSNTFPIELLSDENPVRTEYQKLMRQKSERMSDEELSQEVLSLRTELQEQDTAANQALDELADGLKQVIVEYRGTAAADKAAAALQAMQRTNKASNEAQFQPPDFDPFGFTR